MESVDDAKSWGVDVTDILKSFVSKELNDLKPMACNESFSLSESMSAIEVNLILSLLNTCEISALSLWILRWTISVLLQSWYMGTLACSHLLAYLIT